MINEVFGCRFPCCVSNSWAYTRLGYMHLTQEELKNLLGNGSVTLIIMEKTEE